MTDDSGRPDITFDPCLDIPDEALVEAGYDPASAESTDYPMGTYTFLSCTYRGVVTNADERDYYTLSVMAGNVTLDEEKDKVGDIATEITIGGRRALLEYDPKPDRECTVVLHAEFGIALFSRLYFDYFNRSKSQEERCDGLVETVELLEKFIGDDPRFGGTGE